MTKQKKIPMYERMTNTPIPKLIVTLSIPTIISMLITNVYNLVDTAFVGLLGTSASGAVGIVYGFMSIVQAFGFMFGIGSGSIISRALGNHDNEKANIYASTGILASFLSGLIILIIGFIFFDSIILFLGSTVTIAPYAKDYMFFIILSTPLMTSSLTMNNIIRYEGKAFLGMIGLGAGAILNIIGDPIFMFGLNMGIAGAGLSTALSQSISWLILFSMFISNKTETKISFKNIAYKSPQELFNIMSTGFPSLLRQSLTSFTTVLLNFECAFYGDAAVAAMSIVSRIFFFAFATALGIGQGFQPVAGFNYGAQKFDRLRESYFFTIKLSEVVMIIECLLIFFYSSSLIQFFRNDPSVIEIGSRALRLQALAQVTLPPCMATEMLFQSTGHKLGATILSSVRNGIFFIPLLLILAYFRGLSGIQEAQPIAIVLSLPVCIPFAITFFKNLPKRQTT